jgi:hypothetical protein
MEASKQIDYVKLFKLKWTIIFVMFFMFFICIDLIHVYYHEQVHAAIYSNYNVKYDYGWKIDGIALVFYVQTNDSRNCDQVCRSLQMENEIFSYNIAYVFYGAFMLFLIYLIKCYFDDVKNRLIKEQEAQYGTMEKY